MPLRFSFQIPQTGLKQNQKKKQISGNVSKTDDNNFETFLFTVVCSESRCVLGYPIGSCQMRAGLQIILHFLRSIFVCETCSEMSDNNEHEMVESPLKETMTLLSRTPKGQIVYDRDPLEPIKQSTSNSKSGVLLSENIFGRNPAHSPEKSIDSQYFQHQYSVHHPHPGLNNRPNLLMDIPVQHTEKSINQFKWQQELLMMRNTNQLDETTPVYNLSNHGIMQLFELREQQRLVSLLRFLLISEFIYLFDF